MNTIIKTSVAITLISIGSQAVANEYKTTIEYRHQYVDGSNMHSDRIKAFLDTGKGVGFELDARYNNAQPDQMYDSMTMNGSEFSVFHYKRLNPNMIGLYGLSLDFATAGLVYVPYIRLNYKFENNIRIQARYKWKLWDYAIAGPIGNSYHSKIQEIDAWLGYNTQKWDFQYGFQIWKEMEDNALPQFNGNKINYLHNLRVMYTYKTEDETTWRPFVEVGNVSQSRYTDNRQTRYRVGIKYTW